MHDNGHLSLLLNILIASCLLFICTTEFYSVLQAPSKMNIFKKLLYWELILLCLESFGNSVQLAVLVDDSQELFIETNSENSEINPTPEPFPVSFKIDIDGQGSPYWHHAQTSRDPVRSNWFSYFASWKAADMFHLTEYFKSHRINTDLLKNTEVGFWTSFSTLVCFPGSTTTNTPPTTIRVTTAATTTASTTITTTTTPEPECEVFEDQYPYPHFTLEFQDPDFFQRYILEQLEINYVMHEDSCVVIRLIPKDINAPIKNLTFKQNNSMKWEPYTYNFSSMDKYAKIRIDLNTSSELESGQFIIIDKIQVRALDTFGASTTTTDEESIISTTDTTNLTEETETSEGLTSTLSTPMPGENSAHASLTLTTPLVYVFCLFIMIL